MEPVTQDDLRRFREDVSEQLQALRSELLREVRASEGRAARKACDRVARRLS